MSGSLHPLAPGEIGAVVTYLEMSDAPERLAVQSPLSLEPWTEIDAAAYRQLFRKGGGRWLWFSRLAMDDRTLLSQLGEVYLVRDPAGDAVGMVELDLPEAGECLIRFLGLVPELAGRGHGRWLLAQTLALAWRQGVNRVTVHTCSLDHPAALPAYLRAGFRAYRRALESFPDPRLNGHLPIDAAPQIPIID